MLVLIREPLTMISSSAGDEDCAATPRQALDNAYASAITTGFLVAFTGTPLNFFRKLRAREF